MERRGGGQREGGSPLGGALAAGPGGIQGDTDVDITFKLILTKHLLCTRRSLLFYFSHRADYYSHSHLTDKESDLKTLGNLSQMAQP